MLINTVISSLLQPLSLCLSHLFFFSCSQLSSLHKAHSLRRKKRRNMLSIFGFRRNRNSSLSNQEPDSGGGSCSEECRTVATAPTGSVKDSLSRGVRCWQTLVLIGLTKRCVSFTLSDIPPLLQLICMECLIVL